MSSGLAGQEYAGGSVSAAYRSQSIVIEVVQCFFTWKAKILLAEIALCDEMR